VAAPIGIFMFRHGARAKAEAIHLSMECFAKSSWSRENKAGGATRLPPSFLRTRDRARSLRGMRGYF
jgi:hypothetical protein